MEMAKISSVHNLKPSSSGKLRNWQTEARVKVEGAETEKEGEGVSPGRQAGRREGACATKIGFLVGPGPRVGSIRRHTGDG